MKLKTNSRMISMIPNNDIKKSRSAIDSKRFSFTGLAERIEIKEKKQEQARSNAITDVNSSIILVADLSFIRNEVITKRQNPNKVAEVDKICCDVLLGIRM